MEKRLKISLERFSIKYEDEGGDWILITTDSDLKDRMHSLRLLGRTTMKLLVTPEADTLRIFCKFFYGSYSLQKYYLLVAWCLALPCCVMICLCAH